MYSWQAVRLERRGNTSTLGRVAEEEAKGLVKDVHAKTVPQLPARLVRFIRSWSWRRLWNVQTRDQGMEPHYLTTATN